MPLMTTMPLEEAQTMRKQRTLGPRAKRMQEFDGYAQYCMDHADSATRFEADPEDSEGIALDSKFVLSLRAAFRRAGVENAVVRKVRGKDEVRAWFGEVDDDGTEFEEEAEASAEDEAEDEIPDEADDEVPAAAPAPKPAKNATRARKVA